MDIKLALRLGVAVILGAALGACGGGGPTVGDAATGGDVPADVPSDAPGDTPPTTGARVVYLAQAGVATPLWTPVGATGVGTTVALAPERAAGYGQGQGTVAYPELTPDGARLVVVFQPLAGGSVLYALPLVPPPGGAAPVAVARAQQLSATQRACSDTHIAWIDDGDLYAAPLDGSGLDSPVLVAKAAEGRRVEDPRWAGDRLVFDSASVGAASYSSVRSALADGSEADASIALTPGALQREHAAAVLPGGRVVIYGDDSRLHVAAADGGERVAVTPPDWLASFKGASADGAHIIAELRVTWDDKRHIVSALSDGSDAPAPVFLTPEPVASVYAVVSQDGSRVAWRGKKPDSAQWAVFETSTSVAPASLEAARITAWSSEELRVTDYRGAALVGAALDGRVLRYPLDGGPDATPVVLADVGPIANHSSPWPRLSADATHVLYDANTPGGWVSGVVPVAGGEAVALSGPWYRDLVTPHGILHDQATELAGLFAVEPVAGATPTPLTGWHRGPITASRLVEEGAWVIYASDLPSPGWYAARTDGAAAGGETDAVAVMAPLAESTPWMAWAGTEPLVVAAHFVGRVNGALRSWPLDGSGPGEGALVIEDTVGPVAVHGPSGRVLAVQGNTVVSAPADGSAPPTAVLVAPGPVSALAPLPDGDRVIVLARGDGGDTLLVARVDGSEVDAPLEAATGLPGWTMSLGPLPGGAHALTVQSIAATAVPHPDLVLTSSLVAGPGPRGATLAPSGYVPWSLGRDTERLDVGLLAEGSATPDGAHVLLLGPGGLYSARPDGSEAAAPVFLGAATTQVGPPLGPDGRSVMVASGEQLFISRVGAASSQRALTAPLGAAVSQARWLPSGEGIVFRVQTGASWEDAGRLYRVGVDADSAAPTPLLADGTPLGPLLALTPDGARAVVASTLGGDESLHMVDLGAEAPSALLPLTPIDDAVEVLVGVVPGSK